MRRRSRVVRPWHTRSRPARYDLKHRRDREARQDNTEWDTRQEKDKNAKGNKKVNTTGKRKFEDLSAQKFVLWS